MLFDPYEIHIQAFEEILTTNSCQEIPHLSLFMISRFCHFYLSKFQIFKSSNLQISEFQKSKKLGTQGFEKFRNF